MTLLFGMDISLNHGAVVAIEPVRIKDIGAPASRLAGLWYYTDSAGSADRSREHGARLKVPSELKERQQRAMWRLNWVSQWIEALLDAHQPEFAAVEDYAIRAEQGAHYLGEIGGQVRRALWERGVKFRLHDPISVKMFAAHDGTAQKDSVEEAVRERWGQDFGRFNTPPSGRGKPSRQTSEDLADAYALAKLLSVEVALRAGYITPDKLEHDKERQVFIRTTKTYPVSLLGREWIQGERSGKHTLCQGVCGLRVLAERLGGALPPGTENAIRKHLAKR